MYHIINMLQLDQNGAHVYAEGEINAEGPGINHDQQSGEGFDEMNIHEDNTYDVSQNPPAWSEIQWAAM